MNLFKSGTLTWWQVGALKLSLLCIGIAIGAHWSEIFVSYFVVLLALGLALGFYVAYVWFGQNENN